MTALLGAGALITLEDWYHHDNWSTNIMIRLGDEVFLPVFNALTITQILNISVEGWMVVVACVGTLVSLFVYQIIERHLRESDPSGTVFYHEFFTALASFYLNTGGSITSAGIGSKLILIGIHMYAYICSLESSE